MTDRCTFEVRGDALWRVCESASSAPFGGNNYFRSEIGGDPNDKDAIPRIEAVRAHVEEAAKALRDLVAEGKLPQQSATKFEQSIKQSALEELHSALLDVRDYIRQHRPQLQRPSDISWSHPFDRIMAKEPAPFRREASLKEALSTLGFDRFSFSDESPVLKASLPKYLEALARLSLDGLDWAEFERLLRIAVDAKNPEIPFLLRAAVAQESFVTRHGPNDPLGDRDVTFLRGGNVCFHFGASDRGLPCATLGALGFGSDVFSSMAVRGEPLSIRFSATKALVRLSREVPLFASSPDMRSFLEAIRRHIANVTLVESNIDHVFASLKSPDAAAVVTCILLNITSLSEQIDTETKRLYQSMVLRASQSFGERFLQRIEKSGIDLGLESPSLYRGPGDDKGLLHKDEPAAVFSLLDDIKTDLVLAEELYKDHMVWMRSRIVSKALSQYDEIAANDLEALEHARRQMSSWISLRARLMDPAYFRAVNRTGKDMLMSFSENNKDVYERFIEAGLADSEWGFLGGLLAGAHFTKGLSGVGGSAIKVGIYAPLIVSGISVMGSFSAVQHADDRIPVPLFLPRIWSAPAYVSTDDLLKPEE